MNTPNEPPAPDDSRRPDAASPSDQNSNKPNAASSRRDFLKGLAGTSAGMAAGGVLLADEQKAQASGGSDGGAPVGTGTERAWQIGQPVNGGDVNLATGNLHLDLPVCGWGGLGGLALGLAYNSQSNRATALGPRSGRAGPTATISIWSVTAPAR